MDMQHLSRDLVSVAEHTWKEAAALVAVVGAGASAVEAGGIAAVVTLLSTFVVAVAIIFRLLWKGVERVMELADERAERAIEMLAEARKQAHIYREENLSLSEQIEALQALKRMEDDMGAEED